MAQPPSAMDNIVGIDASKCKYVKKKHLGQGNFGNAWKVEEVATNQVYAGKIMNTNNMSAKDRGFVANEVRCLARCNHPNIVRHVFSADVEGTLLIVMEFADGGDLYKQIKARQATQRYFKEHEILFIFVQLCLALEHIHSKKMMHRDLKTANVLLTSTGLVKLGDFGFSRQYEDTLSNPVGSTFCGTPYYLSPELWQRSPYSKKSEMWALGVVLYEVMALRRPFGGRDMGELIENICKGHTEPLPEAYSPELREMCYQLLQLDPNARPTMRQLFAQPFMKKKGLELLRSSVENHPRIAPDVRAAIVQSIDDALNPNFGLEYEASRVVPRSSVLLRHMGPALGWQPCVVELTLSELRLYSPENATEIESFPIEQLTSVCPIEADIVGERLVFAVKNMHGSAFWLKESTEEGFNMWLSTLQNAQSC